jgi:aminoglycoside 6'-N-acetyltransferase I
MKIIPADESHLAEWLQMRLTLWPECPSDELSQEIDRILGSDREASFLAVDDSGEVLGFVEVSTREYVDGCKTSPVGYLEGLFVRPEYRKQGIGVQLVRACESWAKRRGCIEMGSDVWIGHSESIAFHEALGFRETERQVVFLKAIE